MMRMTGLLLPLAAAVVAAGMPAPEVLDPNEVIVDVRSTVTFMALASLPVISLSLFSFLVCFAAASDLSGTAPPGQYGWREHGLSRRHSDGPTRFV